MVIDVPDSELGIEDLTLTIGGVKQTVNLDIYALADELRREFKKASTNSALTDNDLSAGLREVFKKCGFDKVPHAWNAPHAAANLIVKEVEERQKKFLQTLWGTGDESTVWGVTTDSTQSA